MLASLSEACIYHRQLTKKTNNGRVIYRQKSLQRGHAGSGS